jgi:hypothetical protein
MSEESSTPEVVQQVCSPFLEALALFPYGRQSGRSMLIHTFQFSDDGPRFQRQEADDRPTNIK